MLCAHFIEPKPRFASVLKCGYSFTFVTCVHREGTLHVYTYSVYTCTAVYTGLIVPVSSSVEKLGGIARGHGYGQNLSPPQRFLPSAREGWHLGKARGLLWGGGKRGGSYGEGEEKGHYGGGAGEHLRVMHTSG